MRLRFVFPRVPAVDGRLAIPTIPTRQRRDIGTIPIAHTMAALPHERPVTLTNRRTQMSKVSLIGNSLAYLLCQTRQRANDYRPGMTPEDVRVVFEKSLRGERKKRAATRNDTRKARAVRLSPHASGRT